MGYTTDFQGEVTVDPPLNEAEVSFLKDFNETRRMNRTSGPLFVNPDGDFGQNRTPDIINYNEPHPDQPGLWCQWTPSDDGTQIRWDGGEKFYYATEWLDYIVNKLLSPAAADYLIEHGHEDTRLSSFTFDHTVNGVINAQGEEHGDVWSIAVENNTVSRS